MEITKGSWHHRLATHYSNLTDWELQHDNVNFCEYFWRVVRGFGTAIFLTIVGVLCLGGWVQVGVPTFNWLFNDMPWVWYFDPTPDTPMSALAVLFLVALFLQVVVAVLMVCSLGHDAYREIFPKRTVDNEDQPLPIGFFRTLYRSWKDKFCPIVTLKKDDPDES